MKTRLKNPFLLPVLLASLGLMLAGRAPAQTFTVLHTFNTGEYNSLTIYTNRDGTGGFPLLLSNNTLYGSADYGGTNGEGTVFKINTDGTVFTNLHTFAAVSSNIDVNHFAYSLNNDGENPGPLLLSGNTLYGAAQLGGTNGSRPSS